MAISNIGSQLTLTSQLTTQSTQLGKLAEQLSSGVKNNDLTDYDATTAKQLINYNSQIAIRQGYLNSMTTVQSRLSEYDSIFTDLETVATNAQTLASSNTSYDTTKTASLTSQATAYLKQVQDDLNQKLDGRYIFSGTRYSTQPVTDISTATTTVSYPFTATTSPTLPTYDADYSASTTTSTPAFTQDTVVVDAGYSVTYGVTSNDSSIQKLVAGLQLLKQAQSDTSATTYKTDMQNAATLLSDALSSLQAVHTSVAANINLLKGETTLQNTNITNLQNEVSSLSSVDTAQVSAEITALQTTLEASYSATGKILKLSLVNYL